MVVVVRGGPSVGGGGFYKVRCSPLAFAQNQPVWKAMSLQPARVCSNTTYIEGHVAAARSRLLNNSLSVRPCRCSPLAFAQTHKNTKTHFLEGHFAAL